MISQVVIELPTFILFLESNPIPAIVLDAAGRVITRHEESSPLNHIPYATAAYQATTSGELAVEGCLDIHYLNDFIRRHCEGNSPLAVAFKACYPAGKIDKMNEFFVPFSEFDDKGIEELISAVEVLASSKGNCKLESALSEANVMQIPSSPDFFPKYHSIKGGDSLAEEFEVLQQGWFCSSQVLEKSILASKMR